MLTTARSEFSPLAAKIIRIVGLVALSLWFLTGCGSSGSGGSPPPPVTPTTLAFDSDRALDGSDATNDGVWNIWTIKSDGSSATPITQLTGAAYPATSVGPKWSPDGSKIVFSSGRAFDGSNAADGPFGTLNIWVMNADGSGAKPLTKLTAAQTDCRAPVWSADGSKVAYYSARALDGSDTLSSNPHNIWAMNADGSNDAPLTQLTSSGADSYNPKWSPDGTKLAFESQRALDGSDTGYTDLNIWVVNADGSAAVAITKLTALLSYAEGILWSKDGSKLLFTINVNNIWTAHPDGSGLTALTNLNSSINFADSWSPDGTKLIFDSTRTLDGTDNGQEQGNIWIMNADGSNSTPLTKLTKATAASGVFSPDATQIAYISFRALNGSDAGALVNNIWLIQPDGTKTRPLTSLINADSIDAEWRP